MSTGGWRLNKEEIKAQKHLKNKARINKKYRDKVRGMTPEQLWEHKQFMLNHKLRSVFRRKEYVSYDELPEELKKQVTDFGEILFP
jgi:hypothetical protein